MTKVKVSTGLLEAMLFGSLNARIVGASIWRDNGYVVFEIEGSDVPDVPLVTVQTTKSVDTRFVPA